MNKKVKKFLTKKNKTKVICLTAYWVNKQRRDIYVRQSKVDGYRARSAYKLIEIDEKFKIFKGGLSVIDIGAAPGSWSQLIIVCKYFIVIFIIKNYSNSIVLGGFEVTS